MQAIESIGCRNLLPNKVTLASVLRRAMFLYLVILSITLSSGAQQTRIQFYNPINIASYCVFTDSDPSNAYWVDYDGELSYGNTYICRQAYSPNSIFQICGDIWLVNPYISFFVTTRLVTNIRLQPSPYDSDRFYCRYSLGYLRFIDLRYAGYVSTDWWEWSESSMSAAGRIYVSIPRGRPVAWWFDGSRGNNDTPPRGWLSLVVNETIPPNTVFQFASPPDDDISGGNQPYARLLALYRHRLSSLIGSGITSEIELRGNLSFQLTGNLYRNADPYIYPLWITQAARHGVITIGRIPEFDPQSVNPVGIPEIGENEYVYEDNLARLIIPVFAQVYTWDIYNQNIWNEIPIFNRFYDPTSYRELHKLGNSLIFRLERTGREGPRLSPTGFIFMGNRPVANDYLFAVAPHYTGGSLGNGVGRGLFFEGQTLPDLEYFGRHYLSLYYKESHGREHLVHSAPVEIFFPTLGLNHPARGQSNNFGRGVSGTWQSDSQNPDSGYFIPDGNFVPTPNWFFYYYYFLSSRFPEFSNTPIQYVHLQGGGRDLPLGFANQRSNYFSITNRLAQHISTQTGLLCYLFRRQEDGRLASADRVRVYGIHAFLKVAAHEYAHLLLYQMGIVDYNNDSDGDGVADSWEIIFGLSPNYQNSVVNYHRNDQEFLCDVIAYGYLLANEKAWEYDWADVGLQKGRPVRPFPWQYESTGTNRSRYSDLLTSLDDLMGR